MENRKERRFIMTVLLLGMTVCLIPVVGAGYQSRRHRIQQEELQARQREDGEQKDQKRIEALPAVTEAEDNEGKNAEESTEPVILDQYAALYEDNRDLTGWLSIAGTVIDYPVMQCDSDEYYLEHDFYRDASSYGCLFVKDIADVNTPGTNFIIYGHNMRDGSMFGDLDQYQTKSFFQEHPLISFDTLYEKRTYEVIAVFPSQVYYEDEDVFKYYQFYQADTQEEFNYFYKNIKVLSLYDTGVEAEFGDTFLTLSTCAYHVEDGRFVVVAKRTSE